MSDHQQPIYRDTQLGALLKDLRAAVKPLPSAKIALERVERRLKFVLRVIETWDASHAERAETLIGLGQIEAANTAATMIFDAQLRAGLLARAHISSDSAASDRIAEALELEREVLT